MKRQPSEWEKIIVNEATDKELISKYIQATSEAQFQKNKQPNQKVQSEVSQKEKHQYRISTHIYEI